MLLDHVIRYSKKDTSSNISQNLKCLEHGEHGLVIYSGLDDFRTIYSDYCKKTIMNNDEILVIISQYEAIDIVRDTLRKNGILDAGKYEEQGSLIIIDSVRAYQTDILGIEKLAETLALRAVKEKKKGVSIFADMGSFFLYDKLHELLEYESELPKKFDIPLKGFCCYNSGDFDKLDDTQKQRLFDVHNMIVATI